MKAQELVSEERKAGKTGGALEAKKGGLHLIRRTIARPVARRGDLVRAVGEQKHFLPTGKIEYVLFSHA